MTQVKPETLYSKAREFLISADRAAVTESPEAAARWLANQSFSGHQWTYDDWLRVLNQDWRTWQREMLL